jgi:N-acyl-phosphatidylethanolamine-hydrolysing phospholipase D
MRARLLSLLTAVAIAASTASCDRLVPVVSRNAVQLFRAPRKVPDKIRRPYRADARLAVLWVGHATALLQIDDKLILTDPLFTDTVGMVSRRLVEPGLDPADLPRVDAVVISHVHFDHLSLGSLEAIEDKIPLAILPQGALVYVPRFRFESMELPRWSSWESGGLRITAVPVEHLPWRYGLDGEWMTTSFTGYVIQYHGITVYFGGDTAYDPELFARTAARFPSIDLALLPIAPIEPREYMRAIHVDPAEAVQAFLDLRARWMVPIHYGTFVNSIDAPTKAEEVLRQVMALRGVEDRVKILRIGEQRVLMPRAAGDGRP